jgi:outer membrane murein-binding lipoprotein Lpp
VRLRTITMVAVALAAYPFAGCGSNDEGKQLPRQAVSDLQAQLDSIEARFEVPNGAACSDITDGSDPNTRVVQRILDSLPADTDADLRDATQQSFDHLFDLVERECGQQREQTDTETETTTTETTPTETTTTETTPTETTPTETTPTETTPTETTPPETTPGNQGGNGQGNGGGAAGPGGDEG